MRNPDISVIIPAYRCAATIVQAVDSALKQNVNLEVIVLNDCSPDHLDDVMTQYKNDSRVVYLKNETNLGAARTRNRGVELARGNHIAFLDADDYWIEGKLTKQLQAMESSGSVLSCTARELMTPEGELTGRVLPVKEKICYRDLLRHNSISCSSVMLLRSVALEFPMVHEDSHEDYIAWVRILEKYGQACGVNEPLLKYRLSTTGKSGSKFQSAKMTWCAYRYLGFGPLKSAWCFANYALHGVWKYYLGRG